MAMIHHKLTDTLAIALFSAFHLSAWQRPKKCQLNELHLNNAPWQKQILCRRLIQLPFNGYFWYVSGSGNVREYALRRTRLKLLPAIWTPLCISPIPNREIEVTCINFMRPVSGALREYAYTHVIAVADGFLRPYDRNPQPNTTFGLTSFNPCAKELVQR